MNICSYPDPNSPRRSREKCISITEAIGKFEPIPFIELAIAEYALKLTQDIDFNSRCRIEDAITERSRNLEILSQLGKMADTLGYDAHSYCVTHSEDTRHLDHRPVGLQIWRHNQPEHAINVCKDDISRIRKANKLPEILPKSIDSQLDNTYVIEGSFMPSRDDLKEIDTKPHKITQRAA